MNEAVFLLQMEAGAEPAAPLLFDSPHSGHVYPPDFNFDCPLAWLRQTEDAHVDALFSNAPRRGITFLKALFARSYIDVNRAETDIDPRMLEGVWPSPLVPTERSLAGHGLIRHACRGLPVYSHKVPVADIQRRIENHYRPYHATLKQALQDLRARFGVVWHINCHSMPSAFHGAGLAPHVPPADFILGDRDGAACEKPFAAFVGQSLKALGYRVAHNDPYKGVEILGRYGRPHKGMHSLQLEINRALYMDEKTLQPTPSFEKLQAQLNTLMVEWREWVMRRTGEQKMAAE